MDLPVSQAVGFLPDLKPPPFRTPLDFSNVSTTGEVATQLLQVVESREPMKPDLQSKAKLNTVSLSLSDLNLR